MLIAFKLYKIIAGDNEVYQLSQIVQFFPKSLTVWLEDGLDTSSTSQMTPQQAVPSFIVTEG